MKPDCPKCQAGSCKHLDQSKKYALLDEAVRLLEEWVADDYGDFNETLRKIKELRK